MALTARQGLSAALLALCAVLVTAAPALAHPLGNFTTNTAAGIVVQPEAVRVDYVVDLAEIPTLRAVQEDDLDTARPEEATGYRDRQCAEIADALELRVDGAAVPLVVEGTALSFPPGQAALDTLRLECDLVADGLDLPEGTEIALADRGFPERLGWREVTAAGDGLRLASSDVPEASASDRLTEYPEELLQSPLDVRSAVIVVGASAPRLALPSGGDPVTETAGRAVDALTTLVSRQELTVWFALVAFASALGLGALHALAPGHGKTVMAAFLIGRSGAGRQALGLGITVAITHTAGVLALGMLLSASQLLAPERIFGWLGAASGLLFAGVGVVMLRSALVRNRGHRHGHGHGDHDHDHDHGHGHDHGPHGHTHELPAPGSGWRGLIAPGLAGGLVPSPSALVVLLGGLAIGRAWFGVSLVVAYGIGMAGTLVGIGYLLVRARDRFAALAGASAAGSRIVRVTRQLPVVMASLIIVVCLFIVVRYGTTAAV
jgi:nickel/cobalt transporter (NicO) family protein